MYHGTLTWTKLILKFCYFPVNVPDTLSGKLRYFEIIAQAPKIFCRFLIVLMKIEVKLKKRLCFCICLQLFIPPDKPNRPNRLFEQIN